MELWKPLINTMTSDLTLTLTQPNPNHNPNANQVRWRGGSRRAEDAAKEEGGAAKASEAAEARMLTADAEGLLSASPFGGGVVFTEREHVCEKLWRRVFRLLFMRGGSSAASPAAEA